MPKGVLDIDINETLTVSAEDETSHKKNSMTISSVESMLSRNEIEGMLDDPERFMVEDEELKKKFEAKKSLNNYVYCTRAAVYKQKKLFQQN